MSYYILYANISKHYLVLRTLKSKNNLELRNLCDFQHFWHNDTREQKFWVSFNRVSYQYWYKYRFHKQKCSGNFFHREWKIYINIYKTIKIR